MNDAVTRLRLFDSKMFDFADADRKILLSVQWRGRSGFSPRLPGSVEGRRQGCDRQWFRKNDFAGQAGIGIAMATLIESTVRVTTRHSDNAPIASVAATASLRRDEATGAVRPLKPQAPDDPGMVRIPLMRGRITPATLGISQD